MRKSAFFVSAIILLNSIMLVGCSTTTPQNNLPNHTPRPNPSGDSTPTNSPATNNTDNHFSPEDFVDLLQNNSSNKYVTKSSEVGKIYRYDTSMELKDTGRYGLEILTENDTAVTICIIDFQKNASIVEESFKAVPTQMVAITDSITCSESDVFATLHIYPTDDYKSLIVESYDNKPTTDAYVIALQNAIK